MSQADLSEKESEEKEKTEVQETQNSPEKAEAEKTEESQETEGNQETLSAEEIQDKAEEKAAAEQEAAAKPVIQVPLAPRCENPIIGRKVFFVNPPLYVENYLQPELKLHEYEAYIIKDYKYTKNALRMFPDALCFIFIDDEMNYDGWFNYILSFQQDEKLKTIFVGLMSAMIPQQKREKFMMNLSLPGGFIMLNEIKGSALIENVIGILELNGAKGKRKYLRLDCDDSISINGYFANQTQLLQVSIANISSVGFTCYFPKTYGEALKKNMIVPSFSITLGRRSIVTPSVVFDVKSLDNNYFAVLLFLKQVGAEDRKVIKNFIFEHMEERLNKLIYADPPDIDDYLGKSQKAEEEDETKTEAAAGTEKSENKAEVGAEKSEEAIDEVEEIEEAEEVEAEEKATEEKPAADEKPAEEKSE